MQNIVIDKPYKFIAPDTGTFWPALLSRLVLPRYIRKNHGVHSCEYIGREKLESSVRSGHGIMLAPNHCRPPDPMILFKLGNEVGAPLHVMASWHLFMQTRFQTWMLKHMGVFSMYREGLDRESLKFAVQVLVDAKRPLVLFPEGLISRTNDRLNHLMEGTSFIARTAAKQRADKDPSAKVVIHPVAIRYFYAGDVEQTILPVLEMIEKRLSWQPQTGKTLVDRIYKVGDALLTLKELEYIERPQSGELRSRLDTLIDKILAPLEAEWLKGKREAAIVGRVKALRTAILPDMVAEKIDEAERARRWRQLADVYLAQQLAFYPPDYFKPEPTPEKLLETVERFEEDLTDDVKVHAPLRAVVEIGDAIEVSAAREKSPQGDPLMLNIRSQLEKMLEGLKGRGR